MEELRPYWIERIRHARGGELAVHIEGYEGTPYMRALGSLIEDGIVEVVSSFDAVAIVRLTGGKDE